MESQKPIKKNAAGLRDAIFDEINSMRAGTGDVKRAHAIANLVKQVIDAARVEIQAKQLAISTGNKIHLLTE